ncbi:MAG: indolepyruvate oxidoreductase subunit beta [Betaproteobacteria bacterium]|nr:indolepyruvate oxidoreductase subunit beta [Betaproteobacteria bacterium]MDH5579212.1 indolepyruvate oxidoreductase subunit beta [Betaproteobacteria bacterium]
MSTEILVVGIGGQGVMTAAEAIARAALEAGFEASKTEVAGMSQRGGVVCSQVRIGEHVEASEIRPGTAHLLIAFEAAEGLRWSHFLAPEGWALVDSWRAVPPIVSSGVHKYPEDPAAQLRTAGLQVREIAARDSAERLGDARLANSVMLGAAAALLPIPLQVLRDQVLRRFGGRELGARNAAAFDAGRGLAAQAHGHSTYRCSAPSRPA